MSQEPDTEYLLGALAEDREIVAQIEESIDLLRAVMDDYQFGPAASASLFAYIEGMKMQGKLAHG
ncbi:MAG: hypothetical protein ACYCU8_00025 [Ferrimicrobium acidiphilum]